MLVRYFLLIFLFLNGCSNDSYTKPISDGYVQVDGGKLYYQVFGKGEPVVIVHGGPGLDQAYLQPQFFELARSHEIIFYDQRGSGKSLGFEISDSTMNPRQFAKDLEDLRKFLGLKKISLIGHSWGGFLSLQYALLYPDNINKLVIVNSYPAGEKGVKSFIQEFDKRTQKIKNKINPLFSYSEFIKLDKQQITELYKDVFSVYFYDRQKESQLSLKFDLASARSGFKVMQAMDANPSRDWDILSALYNISASTLVVAAKQDIVPYWTSEEIKNAIPNAQFVLFENCGHFPYIEQPKLFFSAVNEFLKSD